MTTHTERTFPLSEYQKALWHQQRHRVDDPANNMTLLVRSTRLFDFDVFKQAVQTIVSQYPILQSTFQEYDGKIVMEIDPKKMPEVFFEDLSSVPPEARIDRIRNAAHQTIPLKKNLFSITLFKTAPSEQVILISWQHLVGDMFSLNWVVHELLKLLKGEERTVKPEEATYFDFITWQTNFLASETGEKQKVFWKSLLQEKLNAFIPSSKNYKYSRTAAISHITIEEHTLNAISEVCKQEKLTLAQYFLAKHAWILQTLWNEEKLLVMMPVNTRVKKEFLSSLGYYVNFIPLFLECRNKVPFWEFCQVVKKEMSLALMNSYYPINTLFEKDYDRLFRLIYKFQDLSRFSETLTHFPGQMTPWGIEEGIMSLDDNLVAYPRGNMSLVVSHEGKRLRASLHTNFPFDSGMYNHLFSKVVYTARRSVFLVPEGTTLH